MRGASFQLRGERGPRVARRTRIAEPVFPQSTEPPCSHREKVDACRRTQWGEPTSNQHAGQHLRIAFVIRSR